MSNNGRHPSSLRRFRPSIVLLALLPLLSPPSATAAFPGIVHGGNKSGRVASVAPLQGKGKSIQSADSRGPRRLRPFSRAAAAASSFLRKIRDTAPQPLERDDPNHKEDEIAREALEALESIRLCSRAALAAFLSDVFVTLMEYDMRALGDLTWTNAVDLFDSLNILVFGFGLRKVSSIYAANLDSTERLSPETTFDLCSTMAGLWRNTALVMVGVSMSLSACLSEYVPFWKETLTDRRYVLPSVVAFFALVGRLVLGGKCAQDAIEAIERDRHLSVMEGYDRARSEGLVASRNMRFCTASFVLMAGVQLALWLLKPSDVVVRVFSVFDFITPATIAGLLLVLYRGFLRAVVFSTSSQTIKSEGDAALSNLFEAQKGFYTKASETLKSQAIFAILPYMVGFLKPYVLAIFHLVVGKLGLVEMKSG